MGMLTGCHAINGKLFKFADSGALVEEIIQKNGWYVDDANMYYFKEGKLLSSGVHSDGNGLVILEEGWHTTPKGTIYVQKDGTLAYGNYVVDGKNYCFAWGILVEK